MINKLYDAIDYYPKEKNNDYFIQAITHNSVNNNHEKRATYQRLEFLGDSLLQFHTSEYLFKNYKDMNEGEMSLARSSVVNMYALSKFIIDLGIDSMIMIAKNSDSIRNSKKILSDIFESIVGAIYLDGGHKQVSNFLRKNVFKLINKNVKGNLKNPKTVLQEYLQTDSRKTIRYATSSIDKDQFEAKVLHDEQVFGKGIGNSKKEAEVNAATNALSKLQGVDYEIN